MDQEEIEIKIKSQLGFDLEWIVKFSLFSYFPLSFNLFWAKLLCYDNKLLYHKHVKI